MRLPFFLYQVLPSCPELKIRVFQCRLTSKTSCHVVKGRQRLRKVGPLHPFWIYKCLIHSCWFTIYPTGWLPFGRRILVDLDPKGEAVIAEDCWEDTGFGAVVDDAKKKHWPQTCAELLRSISKDVFYYGTRKTQIRHVQGGLYLLALNVDAWAAGERQARPWYRSEELSGGECPHS